LQINVFNIYDRNWYRFTLTVYVWFPISVQ